MKEWSFLYPWQKSVLSWMLERDKSVLALEPGLGKTIITVSWLNLVFTKNIRSKKAQYKEDQSAIIVYPAVMETTWYRAIRRFGTRYIKSKLKILESFKEARTLKVRASARLILVSYNKFIKIPQNTLKEFDIAVFDEAHYLKNEKSKSGEKGGDLAYHATKVVGLSGTFIPKRPIEIHNFLFSIRAIKIGRFQFGIRYCAGHKTAYGWDFNGVTKKRIPELSKLISGAVFELKEGQVLKLPRHSIVNIPLNPNKINKKEINKINKKEINKLKELESLIDWTPEAPIEDIKNLLFSFETASEMYALHGEMKAERSLPFIEDKLDNGATILFAHHKKVISFLEEKLKSYKPVVIKGGQNKQQRTEAIDKFQAGTSRLLIMSVSAGAIGITLTAARQGIFVEFPWGPDAILQAYKRYHRSGQEKRTITYFPVLAGTLDEKILLRCQAEAESTSKIIAQSNKLQKISHLK